MIAVVSRVWEQRAPLVAALLAGAVIAVGISFTLPIQYTSQVTLIPQAPMESGGLLGRLATLTNVGIGLDVNNENLYGQILRSNLMLDRLLDREWPVTAASDSLTVAEVLGMDFESAEPEARAAGVEKFRKRLRNDVIRYSRDPATGFMRLKVTVPQHPNLAADLADYFATELDAYNMDVKVRRAKEHREFIASSLATVTAQLEEAERLLVDFVSANSSYERSPVLSQQYEILEREVTSQRSIWYQLRSELETAKIEEHKQIGSLNILDKAAVPVRKSAPRRSLYALAGGLIGFLLVAGYILVRASGRPSGPA